MKSVLGSFEMYSLTKSQDASFVNSEGSPFKNKIFDITLYKMKEEQREEVYLTGNMLYNLHV